MSRGSRGFALACGVSELIAVKLLADRRWAAGVTENRGPDGAKRCGPAVFRDRTRPRPFMKEFFRREDDECREACFRDNAALPLNIYAKSSSGASTSMWR
jgi:hypothetical protein